MGAVGLLEGWRDFYRWRHRVPFQTPFVILGKLKRHWCSAFLLLQLLPKVKTIVICLSLQNETSGSRYLER